MMMTRKKMTGLLLASTAAALFGAANITVAAEEAATSAEVKCMGINACKGTAECASANNSCKGHNSCKGQGWVHASKEDCDAKGGTVVDE
ncbi:MAG: hypothetical protein WCH04_15990 [Gammaproteobacteria bacterium]